MIMIIFYKRILSQGYTHFYKYLMMKKKAEKSENTMRTII